MKGSPAAAATRNSRACALQRVDGRSLVGIDAVAGQSGERACSIARTVSILSDPWTFLVMREAYFGARRFETFRSALGLPRGTLSDRLKSLTAEGIFRRAPTSEVTRRAEYRMTAAGVDFYPAMIALMQFGDRWLAGSEGPPLQLVHATCGCSCRPFVACSCCRTALVASDVSWRQGPGAGRERQHTSRRGRRSSDPAQFLRGRPSSVSRTLQIIGDRWSCLILREAFLGASRFDRFQVALSIAPNILADRLARLVELGILIRQRYQQVPVRYDYLLTDKGSDLFGPIMAFLAWGDRHRADGSPPMIVTHASCGRDFVPVVICDHCAGPIEAKQMKYRLRYVLATDPADGIQPEEEPGRI